ncbi:helix-turn-helix domain-containing protein [Pseudobacillus sp. FSL P4-0506]|uniref:helix-turn-helix domain-containing protein n=1 Tax=Pseudobacillus sp. FSL P4-0506 TaxID=2921576 RepID=UPI0030FB26EA
MYKVLLLDNEDLMRETLRCILDELEEITVIGEAASTDEALTWINVGDPDIIFLSIDNPGINIQNLCNYLKSDLRKHRVVLLMGIDSFSNRNKRVKIKADGFIRKPISKQHIIKSIGQHVPVHRSGRKSLEEMIDEFVSAVFQNDVRSIKNEWKKLAQLLISSCSHDVNSMGSIVETIVEKLEILSYKEGLFAGKEIKWKEKTRCVDKYTLESTMFDLLEELFAEMIEYKPTRKKKEIQSALHYIENNFHKGVTLEEVASHVHLSPFYLSKLFKKELNVNFVSYVTERKMEKAKELLQSTDMPVLNIALELNYQEPNYFSKVFKKVTGMTPSDFRKTKEKRGNDALRKHHHIQNGKWYI